MSCPRLLLGEGDQRRYLCGDGAAGGLGRDGVAAREQVLRKAEVGFFLFYCQYDFLPPIEDRPCAGEAIAMALMHKRSGHSNVKDMFSLKP